MNETSNARPGCVDDMMWVGDYAEEGAADCPERLAFIVPELGVSVSYAQLHHRVGRMAAWFDAAGLQCGDRVAHYGRNNELYFIILLAAIRRGLVVVPLNWRCAPPEIAFFLEDSEAKLVIGDADFLEVARTLALATAPGQMPIDGQDGLRALIEADGPVQHEKLVWHTDSICLQLYTSGTTGLPKGVLSTHAGISRARQIEACWAAFPQWRGGTMVSAMPNFHIGGKSFVLMGLQRQSTIVITGDASPRNMVRLLAEYGAHRTFIVPTVVRLLLDEMKASGVNLPALESLFYGAAPMSQHLLAEALQTLGCSFVQFFGMTETAAAATCLLPQDHDLMRPERLTSVGKPYPGIDINIRDPAGQALPGGAEGEIWIRTPTVMKGYWHRPDATEAAIKEGWYRTGDGGRIDVDGYLYLTDRIKDMIVSGGENVYPSEVEEVLRRFPHVRDVAVIGVPDSVWGEIVYAVVEPEPGQSLDPTALIAFARTQLAGYKCPRRIVETQALPRTASGKVQRTLIKSQFAAP